MDLDLRKLRYFVAVAEHLNFGRAAEDLHIAQPVLSRQIRALEQELKAGLFVRGPRGTELTAAGQVLLEDARRCCPRPTPRAAGSWTPRPVTQGSRWDSPPA